MEPKVIPQEEFRQIIKTLDEIKELMLKEVLSKLRKEVFDNDEMMEFLKVSKRTLQYYRDKGMISFIQIKGKIYYKYEDIQEFLNKHRNNSFKK